jgi:hypothetical protein
MIEPIAQALDKLQNDEFYYGKYGKQYLSNSDIIYLLKNPTQFRVQQLRTKPMIEGSYFHACMIEPDKVKDFQIVDVASRSTKAYKEVCPKDDILLLRHEAEYIDSMVEKMKGNLEMYDFIYAEGNQYEVPQVEQIMGNWWKGKADIVHSDYLIDIKTSSDIDKFMYSAKTYNYDSQAYLYQRMFGKPMVFFVICKNTTRLGIFDCSSDFLRSGQRKVEEATEIYNKFFSDEANEYINSYIHRQTL